jgi:3-methyladenine DNA glycosylase Tag
MMMLMLVRFHRQRGNRNIKRNSIVKNQYKMNRNANNSKKVAAVEVELEER